MKEKVSYATQVEKKKHLDYCTDDLFYTPENRSYLLRNKL